jgi:outer membrane protein W
MKKLALVAMVMALVMMMSVSASAQGKMAVSVGPDVMLPMGTFGDGYNIGFGGTAQFDYSLTPMLALTGKAGYLTWSVKNAPSGISASYGGVPFLVGAKYFFMPEGKVRAYGHFELGFMFGSFSSSGTAPGFGSYSVSGSSTDFAISPSVGVDIPAGAKGAIDISARYFMIMTTGNSSGNLGIRAAYKFAIN